MENSSVEPKKSLGDCPLTPSPARTSGYIRLAPLVQGRGEGKKEEKGRERKEGEGREKEGKGEEREENNVGVQTERAQSYPDLEMLLGTGPWPNQGSTNGVYIQIATKGPGLEMLLGTANHNKAGDGDGDESRDSHLIQI